MAIKSTDWIKLELALLRVKILTVQITFDKLYKQLCFNCHRCTSCLKYLDLSDSQSAKKKVLAIQTGFAKMVKKCNHRNLKIHEKYWNLNNCFFIFIGWRFRIKWASQCISFKLYEVCQISKDTMFEGYQRWLWRCQGYQVSKL